jgi:probable phosphoglycerate mutase
VRPASSEYRSVVFLARHGQIESNTARRYAGRSSESLDECGRRQALELSDRVAEREIAEVRSSEVPRALETASIVAERLGLRLTTDPRLNEMRLGPWEGLTEDEAEQRHPKAWALWNARPDEVRLPGRETLDALVSRVIPALADAARAQSPVLLITHVAPIRVAALSVLGMSLRHYKCVGVPNAECLLADLALADVRRLGASESLREELVGDTAGEPA